MKKCLSILLVLSLVLCLAACGSSGTSSSSSASAASGSTASDSASSAGTESTEEGLIGFCTLSMSESIYALEEEALIEIFDGKAKVQTASCDQDTATQIQQIKNFITMGADLIVINPTDIEALADAIIEAHNEGIKIYINGATGDVLDEQYYDCCTVSDEYLCGAYVAMVAKNWIEAHTDDLDQAGDWEVAFIESSLSEETLARTAGMESIVEPYLKNSDGDYVDVSGNVVSESAKVANPCYSEIAAAHFTGTKVEQDQTNGGSNVSAIMASNPNTRVFIAYNSLASTQGGQYVVDNYGDEIDQFAFFSAGVMGNEADYMVGAVSATDGVTPSVMRGACQFGVSAAGGEVADSVARTAYAIMYGTEGVDYFKKNPDGIAAWWTVDEDWGSGTATVAHFNILSGATVLAFDPIEALSDENTVIYWNSKDGYIPEETDETAAAETEAETPVEGDSYTYSETNAYGISIDWTLTLKPDGTYVLSEVNTFNGKSDYSGASYTLDGDTVVCGPMDPSPDVYDWADPAGFTVKLAGSQFAPEGVEIEVPEIVPGTYTYAETTPFGEIGWSVTINEDGTYEMGQPDNTSMGCPMWTGTWADNGDGSVRCGDAVGEGTQIADFWVDNGITWMLNTDGTCEPVV